MLSQLFRTSFPSQVGVAPLPVSSKYIGTFVTLILGITWLSIAERVNAPSFEALNKTPQNKVFQETHQSPPSLRFISQQQSSSNNVLFSAKGLGYQALIQPNKVSLQFSSSRSLHIEFSGQANVEPRIIGQGEDMAGYDAVRYQALYPNIDAVFYDNKGQLEYDFIVYPGGHVAAIQLDFKGMTASSLDTQGNLILQVAGKPLKLSKPFSYQMISGQQVLVSSQYRLNPYTGRVAFIVGDYNHAYPLVVDPVVLSSNYIGGNHQDHVYDVAVDSVGNVFLTGETSSAASFMGKNLSGGSFNGVSDVFVTKLDVQGNELFTVLLGGAQEDVGRAITVGANGKVYITGETRSFGTTNSGGIGTQGGFGVTNNAFKGDTGNIQPSEVFVVRLDGQTGAVEYATYMGGNNEERGMDIAVDAVGNMYVAFITRSTDFPVTTSAYQNQFLGQTATQEASGFFVLSADGQTLMYSTYLGGSHRDFANTISLGPNNEVYVAGTTSSIDFPVTNNALYGINLSANAPVPAPVLGAAPVFSGNSNTNSNNSGNADGFIGKFDITQAGAASAIYVTYFGGDSSDEILGMDIDNTGNVHVTGATFSSDILNPGTAGTAKDNFEMFYAKLDSAPNGVLSVLHTHVLGGSATDVGWGISVDAAGIAYIVGETQPLLANQNNTGLGLTDFPATVNPLVGQKNSLGRTDIFVVEYDATGALISSSLFGGTGEDSAFAFPANGINNGFSIAATPTGGAFYIGGSTQSRDFPHTSQTLFNPIATEVQGLGGNSVGNGFLIGVGAAIDLGISVATTATTAIAGQAVPYTITVSNNGAELATGLVVQNALDQLAQGGGLFTFDPAANVGNNCQLAQQTQTVQCALADLAPGASATVALNLTPQVTGNAPVNTVNNASVTAVGKIINPAATNTANNPAANPVVVTVAPNADLSVSMGAVPAPPAAVALNGLLTYKVSVISNGPSLAQGIVVSDTLPAGVTFVSATTATGTCQEVAGVVTCNMQNLSNGTNHLVDITVQAVTEGNIVNSVTVAATTGDNTPGNNTLTLRTQVSQSSDLSVSITNNQAPSIIPGSAVSYTILAQNLGAVHTIRGAAIDFPVPQGLLAATVNWTCQPQSNPPAVLATCDNAPNGVGTLNSIVTLPPNSRIQYTVNATIDPAARGTVVATVTGIMPLTLADSNALNNSASDVDELTPEVNLKISSADAVDPVVLSADIIYTVTVRNQGPSQATAVSIQDTLPNNTSYVSSTPACNGPTNGLLDCPIGIMNPNDVFSFEIRVTAPATSQSVSNLATILFNPKETDPNTADNSVTENTLVDPPLTDISLIMSTPSTTINAGSTADYSATIKNNGPLDAANTRVILKFANASLFTAPTGFTCTVVNTNEINCLVGNIAAGATVTATATFKTPSTTGGFTVSGQVISDTTDTKPSNNFSLLALTVMTNIQVVGASNAGGNNSVVGAASAGSGTGTSGAGSFGVYFILYLGLMSLRRYLCRRKQGLSLIMLGLLSMTSLVSSNAWSASFLGDANTRQWYVQGLLGTSSFSNEQAGDVVQKLTDEGFLVTYLGLDSAQKSQEYLFGYQFRPSWNAEFGYINMDNTTVSTQASVTDIDAFLSAVLRHVPTKSRGLLFDIAKKKRVYKTIDVVAKAGAFLWRSKISTAAIASVNGNILSRIATRKATGTNAFLGAGAEFNFSPRWSMLIEWKHFFGNSSVDAFGGGFRYTPPFFGNE